MVDFTSYLKNVAQATRAKYTKHLGIATVSIVPGLLLSAFIALISLSIYNGSFLSFLNPLLIAAIFGIVLGNTLSIPKLYQPGIKFSMKEILRLSVILLGLRLSLSEILGLGLSSFGIIILSSMSTFLFTCWLGKVLKVNYKLTQLIAAGTSICGASAIVATNSVVDSSEEDITYAIALITGLGTIAMISYPLIPELLSLSPEAFGFWCGASIHEVAQVVAAAFQNGNVSGEFATITKLSRVLLLIPVIFMLGWTNRKTKHKPDAKSIIASVPWFILIFGLLVIVNTLNIIPSNIKDSVLTSNQFLLCTSMAAMGLETKFNKLNKIGIQPFYLAIGSWIFISLISLILIEVAMPY